MAKPTYNGIAHGQQAWDADLDDNFDILGNQAVPIPEYANYAALPAANQYDRCVAATVDGNLWVSNGTDWKWLCRDPEQGPEFGAFTRLVTKVEELIALVGASVSTANLFPAGCYRLGASAYVTTLITGATDWDMEDSGSAVPNLYAAAKALAVGTTVDPTDFTASPFSFLTATEGVKLVANGGNFTDGDVRVVAHYLEMITPTS